MRVEPGAWNIQNSFSNTTKSHNNKTENLFALRNYVKRSREWEIFILKWLKHAINHMK